MTTPTLTAGRPALAPATPRRDEDCLYARVLGPLVATLHPDVAALHLGAGCARASGTLDVRLGRGSLTRLLAILLRLPHDGTAVPVALEIARHGEGERWWRRFGSDPLLTSTQRRAADGTLRERYGPLELRFATGTSCGGLRLDATGACVGWGRAALRLPAALVPHVTARVLPAAGGGAHVAVRIALPLVGTLLSYDGRIEKEDDR